MNGLIIIILAYVVFGFIASSMAKAKKKYQAKTMNFEAEVSTAQHSYKPEPRRPAPVRNRQNGRDFSQPDAHCVVCEQTGVDHFARDKAQRIAQLDNWLEIGLIDREEYRVLKKRFQKGL